nr:probable LRR receptor-like serine/threonine-protein kinase At3g47570 isoform X1 [Ipomoea trifida]
MKMNHRKTLPSSFALFAFHHHLLFCLIICSVTLPIIPSVLATHLSNETDKLALLNFKHQITYDPQGVLLKSWNESMHHCGWQGVSCGHRHQRVVALRLPEMGLGGTISPHIGNLSFLRVVNLGGNQLQGEIPREIGGLLRLRYLNLSVNTLTGDLAALNLSNCLQLRKLLFTKNGLHGKLPTELANLKKLQILFLNKNQLTGGIPPAFGNLSMLQVLRLEYNHLEGNIPHEITHCWGLTVLSLEANNFTGTLSSAFFNMTSLAHFAVSENSLHGTIPSNIGNTMPNLEVFYFGLNKFHGTIPTSFPNASKLQYLEVSRNYLVGKVPDNIGKLKDLIYLNLEVNRLGSTGPLDDLTFITSLSNCSNLSVFSIYDNKFEGKLPNTIGNLSSKLLHLFLGGNKLYGTIPISIKNLVSLTALAFGENFFSGVIPSEIGYLQKLQLLSLEQNQFSAEIPSTLYNLTSLAILDISVNNLDGNIPPDIENFRNLNLLLLSSNKLSGTIPQQVYYLPSLSKNLFLSDNSFIGPLSPAVGKLKTLNALDISGNKLSGKIPETIGDCLSLEYLYMNANRFDGKIPHSLVSLKRAMASTFGDVYCFGILLLEMFTGKRPTDDLFNSEYNSLYEYVEAALPQVLKIVDPLLLASIENKDGLRADKHLENHDMVEIIESKIHSFFRSIFIIGLTCASRSPMDRMHMNDVNRELHKIKKDFLVYL